MGEFIGQIISVCGHVCMGVIYISLFARPYFVPVTIFHIQSIVFKMYILSVYTFSADISSYIKG